MAPGSPLCEFGMRKTTILSPCQNFPFLRQVQVCFSRETAGITTAPAHMHILTRHWKTAPLGTISLLGPCGSSRHKQWDIFSLCKRWYEEVSEIQSGSRLWGFGSIPQVELGVNVSHFLRFKPLSTSVYFSRIESRCLRSSQKHWGSLNFCQKNNMMFLVEVDPGIDKQCPHFPRLPLICTAGADLLPGLPRAQGKPKHEHGLIF